MAQHSTATPVHSFIMGLPTRWEYLQSAFLFIACYSICMHTLSQLWDYIVRKRTIHCISMLALWDLTHFQALTLGLIFINCTLFVDDYYFPILRCGTLKNPYCSMALTVEYRSKFDPSFSIWVNLIKISCSDPPSFSSVW